MFPTALVLSLMSHADGVKPRPRHELVMRAVHPIVGPGVKMLSRLGLEPWQVVVSHGVLAAVAAALIALGSQPALVVAALLLQARTVLDNLDGALARATGRVTELGRYLDTGVDLLGNACLFVALATHGPWWAALSGFVVLMLLLTYDFNAERLYREAHGEAPRVHSPEPAQVGIPASPGLRFFRGLYAHLLAPQDQAVRTLERRLLESASGKALDDVSPAERRSWWGLASTASLVNLGLSTQNLALGVCLVLGRPFAYVWLVLAQGVYLVLVLIIRYGAHRRRRGSLS